jgi:hypothetical protein
MEVQKNAALRLYAFKFTLGPTSLSKVYIAIATCKAAPEPCTQKPLPPWLVALSPPPGHPTTTC